jgi:uncharacterized lipoprotein YddW (UPF0748 family)
MNNYSNKKLILYFLSVLFFNVISFGQTMDTIPSVFREMRAVWVATVANIDWPSKPGLSTDEQKKEVIAILDRVKHLKMNTIILQVRPQADAIYQSNLEPWSFYLTGLQGKAPEPFYDPLQYWIDESHNRGLELHAWLNPYRAIHSAMQGEISPLSIVKNKPHCVHKLGNAGYYWMDPALQEVQDHSYAVVLDIVKRYDVDAIHLDDYFYPYRDYNDGKDFPDDEVYSNYKFKGGKLSKGDWRRNAVNKFVKRLYEGIKKEKPWVKFGISPYGVYRPGYPSGMGGTFDQYEILSADAKLWLNKGWCDYYVPQLYWNISRMELSYPLLLNWWMRENTLNRNLWPGLFIRPEIESKTMSLEIVNQIMVTRGMNPDRAGNMLFSMKSLMNKDSFPSKYLSEGPYKTEALIPNYPWIDKRAPEPPDFITEKKEGELKIILKQKGKEKPFLYVLYIKNKNIWTNEIYPANVFEIQKKFDETNVTAIAITSVDRCGNESKKNFLQF